MRTSLGRFANSESNARWLLDCAIAQFGRGEDGLAGEDRVFGKARDAATYASGSEVYLQALEERRKWFAEPQYVTRELTTKLRVLVGRSDSSVLETSLHLHPVFGIPLIRGESLKGLIRVAIRRLVDAAGNKVFEISEKEIAPGISDQKVIDFLLGSKTMGAGTQVMDAWWVPGDQGPLVFEVDTPMHRDYYGSYGAKPATDFDDPNPIRHLAAHGRFLFAIRSHTQDAAAISMAILVKGLDAIGVGSWVNTDEYGRFK